jgi:molecular chaperone GrpE
VSARKTSTEDPEGWESLAEEASGGTLAPNPELEEALREAADALDRPEDPPAAGEASGGGSREQELAAELVETRDRLLRLQADFENFRRRAAREREEALHYGHQNLVKDLLATVDNLDRAIEHVERSEQSGGGDIGSLLQGVELVRRELLAALAKHSVSEIEAHGTTFDPALHEAMAQAPDDSVPANTVIDVLQKGYQLRDRLLRPTRVVVSTGTRAKDGDRDDQGDESGKGEAAD